MKKSAAKAPVDRSPAVTIVVLEADAPNLGARLLETAAQDYFGPLEILAIASKDAGELALRLQEYPWASPAPRAAEGGAAIELALSLTRAGYLAFLPRHAHPDPLWIDALVEAAVAHPEAFAIAPRIVRSSGVLLAAGVERSPEGRWHGSEGGAAEEPAPVGAAVGDGLLVSVSQLSRCLPLDPALDARSLGVDLSLAAKSLGSPIFLAPRARVVVSTAGSANGDGRLHLEPDSELLLIAKREPARLASLLGGSGVLLGKDAAAAAALVREALARAGYELSDEAVRLVAESLGEATVQAQGARDRQRELEARVGQLESQLRENAARLHKEMSWAHELDRRLLDANKTGDADRARVASEHEAAASELKRDADWMRSELAATQENLGIAQRELEWLRRRLEAGTNPNDLRIQDLEQRWRRAEERCEAATRELGTAHERMRMLEQAFRTLERVQTEVARHRGNLEAQLQQTLERAKRAEELGKHSQEATQGASGEREAMLARLGAAEAGFDAAARSLHTNKTEMDRLRTRLADAQTRRDLAERTLAEMQDSKTAEKQAAAFRLELEAANARVEAADQRLAEPAARLAEVRQQNGELARHNERLRSERGSIVEALTAARAAAAALEANVGELRAARAELESALADTRARLGEREIELASERARFDANKTRLEASLAELESSLAQSQRSLAAAEGALATKTRENQETARSLATERAARAASEERGASLESDLAAARESLESTRGRLDESLSALSERVGDLARLRAAILLERDRTAERMVGLIEEVRRRRLFRRPLSEWEREFLTGPGAGYVREPLR